MPRKYTRANPAQNPCILVWTPAMDATILAGRAAGKAWTAIGAEMHCQPNALRKHAQDALGLPAYLPGREPSREPAKVAEAAAQRARTAARRAGQVAPRQHGDDRAPLAAGHPSSWGAISGAAWSIHA